MKGYDEWKTFPEDPRWRLSNCDICDERPGIAVLIVHGCETVVCGHCSDDPEADALEELCICRGDRAAKNCPAHGQDPDEAYDRMRDEGIGDA